MKRSLPKSLPGRRCSWCGELGGAGFAALVRNLMAAGVTFKHLNHSGIEYLHPECARLAQQALRREGDDK